MQALDTTIAEGSSSPLTRRVVYERIHVLLRHLLTLVPTLPSTLQPLLIRNFPHKRQSQAAQVTYIRNLLSVMEYCPELADSILATIVDRAIQIDVRCRIPSFETRYSLIIAMKVEIQVEVEDLEERLAACEDNEVFELDPFDTLVGQEEDSDSESDEGGDNLSDLSSDAGGGDGSSHDSEDVPSDYQHIQEMLNKLDAILKLIFDHFDHTRSPISSTPIPSSSSPSRPDTPSSSPLPTSSTQSLEEPSQAALELERTSRRSQFYVLLSIFDRIILRTFKSRYTQFLVFWYSSLDPEFSDTFQGTLISKALLEGNQPTVTRTVAASYIASFVSRAHFVDGDSARRVVGCLCDFLKSRLNIWEASQRPGEESRGMEMGDLNVFYAVAQAVFLIFCFRWRDLVSEHGEGHDEDELDVLNERTGGKWIKQLDILRRAVVSDLNPLKVRQCYKYLSPLL